MELAFNVKSEKAYYSLLEQSEKLGYKTPLHIFPTHMHKWNEYGRKTVLFINTENKFITYEDTEYAKDKGYFITRFRPTDNFQTIEKTFTS